jgi:hypothetical protein
MATAFALPVGLGIAQSIRPLMLRLRNSVCAWRNTKTPSRFLSWITLKPGMRIKAVGRPAHRAGTRRGAVWLLPRERVDSEYKFLNRHSADEVFLHDTLDHFRRDGVVPDAIGIHYRDRALFANLQAIGLGSKDAVLALHQPDLDQPLLQILPGRIAHLVWSALRFRLIRAQEDVALEVPNAERASFLRKMLLFV